MLGVSPVRVAPKGTVIGTYERSLGLDIAHLPSYPPLLNRFMVAGLHCYYGGSDYCSWSLFLGFASWFAPCSLMLGAGPGSLVSQTPSKTGSLPGICVLATSSSPCLSRLDFGPFHLQPPHSHFATIALARYITVVACRVYPPNRRIGSGEIRRAVKGSNITRSLPDRLGRIEFACATDWSFPQVALHPSLRKTQLPFWLSSW